MYKVEVEEPPTPLFKKAQKMEIGRSEGGNNTFLGHKIAQV